jgi:hypothetical protein
VTLGPRAKRRAGWAAVVALIVIGGVGYRLSTSTSHAATSQEDLPNMSLGIAYGFTPAQVRHRLGAPDTTHGRCWIYRASKVGTVRGINAAMYTDAVRFCFSGNIVSDVRDHQISYVWHKTRYPAHWMLPMTYAPSYETVIVTP